jgi:glucosamine--fructose-6-phosphate aminotransferase (isomerizing)
MEGALKLKEVSYIHAEGYPAGEMKHGPIALIDENLPVVALVTNQESRDKMLNNISEVKVRGGIVISVTTEGDDIVAKNSDYVLSVPKIAEPLSPIITAIPLQLLAYYIAILRDCDVDQPRNLAKSVTVE